MWEREPGAKGTEGKNHAKGEREQEGERERERARVRERDIESEREGSEGNNSSIAGGGDRKEDTAADTGGLQFGRDRK